jgi:hypothetical protein
MVKPNHLSMPPKEGITLLPPAPPGSPKPDLRKQLEAAASFKPNQVSSLR